MSGVFLGLLVGCWRPARKAGDFWLFVEEIGTSTTESGLSRHLGRQAIPIAPIFRLDKRKHSDAMIGFLLNFNGLAISFCSFLNRVGIVMP